MYLEIVTPEAVVFKADINAVKVPGHAGEFQMLNNHAPIVSILVEGEVKIEVAASNNELDDELSKDFRRDKGNSNVLYYTIKGGVLEMKDNKAIILAD